MVSLKAVGLGLSRAVSRAWDSVSRGWRELIPRSGHALTRFIRPRGAGSGGADAGFAAWSLLAGEVIDKGRSITVQLEIPGVDREDLDLVVRRDSLYVRGERREAREHVGGRYYVMERAYGSFQRVVPLPHEVDASRAEAKLRNGVLTVTIPKTESSRGGWLTVR